MGLGIIPFDPSVPLKKCGGKTPTTAAYQELVSPSPSLVQKMTSVKRRTYELRGVSKNCRATQGKLAVAFARNQLMDVLNLSMQYMRQCNQPDTPISTNNYKSSAACPLSRMRDLGKAWEEAGKRVTQEIVSLERRLPDPPAAGPGPSASSSGGEGNSDPATRKTPFLKSGVTGFFSTPKVANERCSP